MKSPREGQQVPAKKREHQRPGQDMSFSEKMQFWSQYSADYIYAVEKDHSRYRQQNQLKKFPNISSIIKDGSQPDQQGNNSLDKLFQGASQQSEVKISQNQSAMAPFTQENRQKMAPMKKKTEAGVIQVTRQRQTKAAVNQQDKKQVAEQQVVKIQPAKTQQVKIIAKSQEVKASLNQKPSLLKTLQKINYVQPSKQPLKTVITALRQQQKEKNQQKEVIEVLKSKNTEHKPTQAKVSAIKQQNKALGINKLQQNSVKLQQTNKAYKKPLINDQKIESQPNKLKIQPEIELNKLQSQQEEEEVVQQENDGPSFYQIIVQNKKQSKLINDKTFERRQQKNAQSTVSRQKDLNSQEKAQVFDEQILNQCCVTSLQNNQLNIPNVNPISHSVEVSTRNDENEGKSFSDRESSLRVKILGIGNRQIDQRQLASERSRNINPLTSEQSETIRVCLNNESNTQQEKTDQIQSQEYVDENHFVTCLQAQESYRNQSQLQNKCSLLQFVQSNSNIFQQQQYSQQNSYNLDRRVNSIAQSFFKELQSKTLSFNYKVSDLLAEMEQMKQKQEATEIQNLKLRSQSQKWRQKYEQSQHKNFQLADALQRQKKHCFDSKIKIQQLETKLKELQEKDIFNDAKQMKSRVQGLKRNMSHQGLHPKHESTPQDRKIPFQEQKNAYNSDQESQKNPSEKQGQINPSNQNIQKKPNDLTDPLEKKEEDQSEDNSSDIEDSEQVLRAKQRQLEDKSQNKKQKKEARISRQSSDS